MVCAVCSFYEIIYIDAILDAFSNQVVKYVYDAWGELIGTTGSCFSAAEVAANPLDPWAWAWLAGDIIDLVPFVTGVGESTKVIGATVKVANKVDDSYDVIRIVKTTDFTDDAIEAIRTLDKVGDATKSIATTGTRIHRGYRVSEGTKYIKEFTIGKNRIDFFDEPNNIIYELKPNNPRGIKDGIRQLQRYNKALGGGKNLIVELY